MTVIAKGFHSRATQEIAEASEVLLQPFDELEDMKSSVGSKTNFIHQRALIISFEIIPKGNFDLDFLESNPD